MGARGRRRERGLGAAGPEWPSLAEAFTGPRVSIDCPLPGPRGQDQGCCPASLAPRAPPCPGPGVPNPQAEGQWELRAWAGVRTPPPPALQAISPLLAPGPTQQSGRWAGGKGQESGPTPARLSSEARLQRGGLSPWGLRGPLCPASWAASRAVGLPSTRQGPAGTVTAEKQRLNNSAELGSLPPRGRPTAGPASTWTARQIPGLSQTVPSPRGFAGPLTRSQLAHPLLSLQLTRRGPRPVPTSPSF